MADPAETSEKTFELSEGLYRRFRDLILARTGMLFDERRREALARGVAAAAVRAGEPNPKAFYRLLQEARPHAPSWRDLIAATTVGETYFFRNPAHIGALRRHILPDLIARRRESRRLRIWSAGCATGEEPYSIAILLHQLLPDLNDWDILILATDINERALGRAREGRYRPWSFRQVEPAIQERYFSSCNGASEPMRGRCFEISPGIRERVTFAYLNLIEENFPSSHTDTREIDLILCRNVTMYLTQAATQAIANRFYRCLVPEGWLIVGASETNQEIYRRFATRNLSGAILYQKTEKPVKQQARKWQTNAVPPFPLLPPPSQPARRDPSRSLPAPRLPDAPKEPLQDMRRIYEQGVSLAAQNRPDKAKAQFLACLEREPNYAPACHQMARLEADAGRLQEAQEWAEKAIRNQPLLAESHFLLALIHQEEGQMDRAIARLKKVLYLDADFVLAHLNLAALYRKTGCREEAARHRSRALRLAANLPPDQVLPGSDDLTAGQIVRMIRAAG